MHHIWRQKGQTTLVGSNYTAKIENRKTHAEATISLPQDDFFADGSNLSSDQAQDIIKGMIAFLNMTET
jgi:hypothetical protein